MSFSYPRVTMAAAAVACALLAVAGCGSSGSSSGSSPSSTGSAGSAAPTGASLSVPENTALHAELPASVRSAGTLVAVNTGSFPPYDILASTGGPLSGASGELEQALGSLLGIKITNVTVSSLPTELTGMKTGRYSLDLGPDGDFTSREGNADFIDWVTEHVVFAVQKGNPDNITSLGSTCGLKVSVMEGGSAEQVLEGQSTTCKQEGKPAVQVQSYQDQPTALLAVTSGRADAFFSSEAPLTYFVNQTHGQLQLAGTGSANGFSKLYQGAMVTKGSPLSNVLLSAMQILFKDGIYQKIMQQSQLQKNMIPAPGLDLAAHSG
jgi:polar amino acid transport system substrate-binding protein